MLFCDQADSNTIAYSAVEEGADFIFGEVVLAFREACREKALCISTLFFVHYSEDVVYPSRVWERYLHGPLRAGQASLRTLHCPLGSLSLARPTVSRRMFRRDCILELYKGCARL